MKISRSLSYVFIASGYIAENQQDGPVSAMRISKEYNISLEYLLKILQMLVKAKVIKSRRGPRGGFLLACDPKDISLLQIVEAIDGPVVRSLQMVERTHSADFSFKMETVCKNVAERALKIYDKAKLADMLQ